MREWTSLAWPQQQVVEIAKALSQNARILVMDEPTAALSEPEIAMLFDRIRKLKQDGIAIIYISHRLREVFEIGDRITVLARRPRGRIAHPQPDQCGRAGATHDRPRSRQQLWPAFLREARRVHS